MSLFALALVLCGCQDGRKGLVQAALKVTRYEMNPEELPKPYGWAPHQVTYNDFLVRLVSVDPHPEMPEDAVDFENYQATFVISLEE